VGLTGVCATDFGPTISRSHEKEIGRIINGSADTEGGTFAVSVPCLLYRSVYFCFGLDFSSTLIFFSAGRTNRWIEASPHSVQQEG